jgi:hypothetical protein
MKRLLFWRGWSVREKWLADILGVSLTDTNRSSDQSIDHSVFEAAYSNIATHDNVSEQDVRIVGADVMEKDEWFVYYREYVNNELQPAGGAWGVSIERDRERNYTAFWIYY